MITVTPHLPLTGLQDTRGSYWEHLGMLDVDSYARSWRHKRDWYERSGFIDRLIASATPPVAVSAFPR